MINEFLSFRLCKSTILKISFNIDIKECGNTSNTHCSTVLCLDSCQISKIQPLECFSCIFSRLGNIITVCLSHCFHAFQCTNLICDFLTKLEVVTSHTLAVTCCEVFLFSFDQSIDTIQSYTSVVTYDTSTAICVRKTCKDLVMTGHFHLWCVDIKYTLVMSLKFIVVENIFNFITYFVSIGFACLLCHFDTTVWHECTFERFVGLKSYNLFQILEVFINISRTISSQRGYNFCLHVQNSAVCTLCFLQFLKFTPKFVCCLSRSFQEGIVPIIWCVVQLNKVTNVDFLFPTVPFKAIPLFKIFHSFTSFSKIFPRISH